MFNTGHAGPVARIPWNRTTAGRRSGLALPGVRNEAIAAPGAVCWSAGGAVGGMTSFFVVASELARDKPEGPPWFKWAFLGVWAALLPWILYKLHQHGYFKRRR